MKRTQNDALGDRLSRSSEINVAVTGRKSGRTISNPVWFVLDEDQIYLLPVRGSDTQWYQNVVKNPSIRITAHIGARQAGLFAFMTPLLLFCRSAVTAFSQSSTPVAVPFHR